MEPNATPQLKIAMPKARSRTGNHSAITLAAPGQLPASPSPSRKRSALRLRSPVAKAWPISANDHSNTESVKPRRVPRRS